MVNFHILIFGVLHAAVASTMVEEEFPLLCNNSVVLPSENIEHYDDGSIYDPKSGAIYPNGTYWKDEENRIVYGCPYDLERPCLWKCCPFNQAIQSTSNNCTAHSSEVNWFKPIVKSDDGKWNRSVTGHEHFVLFYGHCGEGMSMILEEEYILRGAGGSMVLQKIEEPFQMEAETFCVDYAVDLDRYVAYHCSNDTGVKEEPETSQSTCKTIIYIVYLIGLCISIIFLIIWFFVYASMPELRNLNGKCLLCYIASLTTGHIFMVMLQFGGSYISNDICQAAGFVMYFAILSTFLWLNIICIDISIAFSVLRPVNGTGQDRDGRKFLLYMLYAWGLPLLPLGISLYMEFGDVPNHLIKPNLRMVGWFPTTESVLVYYIGPVATITFVNVALFIYTAVQIFKQKEQTKIVMKGDSRRHGENDEKRKRFNLYLKLFIVMGVNWVLIYGFEIINLHVNVSACIFIPSDLFINLQGFFVFLIFVWKANIRRKVMKRLFPRFASRMKKQDKPGSSSSDHRSISTVSSAVADGEIKLSSYVVNLPNFSKVHCFETGERFIPSNSFGVCVQQDY